MGLSFGGSSGGSKLTRASKRANAMQTGAIDPSYQDKYMSPGFKDAVASGTEFGGYYQGAPGVGTFTSDSRYIEPGTDERLPTIMPGYEALSNYDTLLGQFDQGNLSQTQNAFIGAGANIATNGLSLSGDYGGASLGGGAGSVPAPPDFANRTLNVDNIGGLVGDIFDDMPPIFQEFTVNMLNAADPTEVEAQVSGFVDQVTEYTQMMVESTGRAAMDLFGAQGVGGSGTAVAGLMDIAVRATVESSARITEYALTKYDQIIKQQGIAQQLMNDYLGAGATEQANRVNFEMSKLQAEASAYGSYASAQASVISSLQSANATIQSSLINADAQLQLGQMRFVGDQLGYMYDENARVNEQNTEALLQPYAGLGNMQGLQNSSNPSSGFEIGGIGSLLTGLGPQGVGLFG